MGFRYKYINSTGLKIDRSIHIHHIDSDRRNNELSNLIHIKASLHLSFHVNINVVNAFILNSKTNGFEIDDIENNYWMLSQCIFCNYDRKKIKNLLNIEKVFVRNIHKRNKKLGINSIPVFINNEQRKVINILSNR